MSEQVYTREAPLLAWHLGPGDPEAGIVRSTYRTDIEIRLGETVSARNGIAPCLRGPHGSVRAVDALAYGTYPVLSRVALWGRAIPHGNPTDKHVAEHRTHLAMADAHRLIPLWCAARVVRPMLQSVTGRTVDPHEWAALDLVERWAADPEAVTADELDAAAWTAVAAWAAWAARDARAAWAARAARAAWAAWAARAAADELDRAFRWLVRETEDRPAWVPASITPGKRAESEEAGG
jgi:hypothetical protein